MSYQKSALQHLFEKCDTLECVWFGEFCSGNKASSQILILAISSTQNLPAYFVSIILWSCDSHLLGTHTLLLLFIQEVFALAPHPAACFPAAVMHWTGLFYHCDHVTTNWYTGVSFTSTKRKCNIPLYFSFPDCRYDVCTIRWTFFDLYLHYLYKYWMD